MRVAVIVILPFVLACATRPTAAPTVTSDSSASTRMVRERVAVTMRGGLPASVAAFVPAVPASDSGGECETISIDRGSRLLLLSFPTRAHAQRNVALTLDSAGALTNYSDVRGDLRRPELRTGAVTAVVVTFERGTASATNEWPDRPGQLVVGTPAAILAADNLGRPGDMIREVMARCAPPSQLPALAREALHNVAFYGGSVSEALAAIRP